MYFTRFPFKILTFTSSLEPDFKSSIVNTAGSAEPFLGSVIENGFKRFKSPLSSTSKVQSPALLSLIERAKSAGTEKLTEEVSLAAQEKSKAQKSVAAIQEKILFIIKSSTLKIKNNQCKV